MMRVLLTNAKETIHLAQTPSQKVYLFIDHQMQAWWYFLLQHFQISANGQGSVIAGLYSHYSNPSPTIPEGGYRRRPWYEF